MRWAATAGLMLLVASPAWADERDYCPARPGLGTPPCTIAPGRVSVEIGIADWTRDDSPDARDDTVLIADTLVRIGVTDTLEAQIGWTPFGYDLNRDKIAHETESTDGIGDVTLGFKANLANPDGSGLSAAVQPFVTLPVGRQPIGAGDWGAGLVVPVTYDLNGALDLQFTPEAGAAVDDDGNGRHFAYSGTIGLQIAINEVVSGTIEFQALRDDDPSGATTQRYAALSLAWMPTDNLQLDIGATAGLDRDSADAELYAGVSRRF